MMLEEDRHFDIAIREGKVPRADCGVILLAVRNETLIARVICEGDAVNLTVLPQPYRPVPEILDVPLRYRVHLDCIGKL